MNIHVSEELKKRWPQYEFIGGPIRKSNGREYYRAKRKFWPWEGHVHIYSVKDDFFWHDISLGEVP